MDLQRRETKSQNASWRSRYLLDTRSTRLVILITQLPSVPVNVQVSIYSIDPCDYHPSPY